MTKLIFFVTETSIKDLIFYRSISKFPANWQPQKQINYASTYIYKNNVATEILLVGLQMNYYRSKMQPMERF